MHSYTDDLIHFLALRLAARGRAATFSNLLLETGDVHAVAAMVPWPLTPAIWHTAQRQATALRALGIEVVYNYALPSHLLRARPRPAALFIRGNSQLLRRRGLAVVGSRRASSDAVRWAQRVAARRAAAGTLIISGGAAGIDAAAHRGALSAGQPTVAYIGSAVDAIYPPKNKLMYREILANGGAVVSEHPPFSVTAGYHHAARNRFIAAHATALLVVEAAIKSGTLGTAKWARQFQATIWVSPAHVGALRAGIETLLENAWARVYEEEGLSTICCSPATL